ncbi:LacI family DNA-binding transcriptional regulator [Paralimibaculum aggregatum]|uniref:LacI family DNA-binding transcriptional regulator n=1 Tax=Paralimibaculum aggregatum TaxID=3036245 RepID=A0ABQ6LL57_9RHOB|nr:LacI family DNA-binding transcriptional regulator [Limibaculum sp. NKW23]GMG82402.1 LacI family DNA-binding transcriptional regulator [Limibaculum sp. NKW23]
MNKPTVHDIAKEAGVSLATVDRVLNARPGVRKQTIARVQEAVARLGYVRDTSAANLARQRQYRFVFVLPEGPSQFVDTLTAALREATAAQIADRLLVKIVTIPAHDPHGIVRVLQGLNPARLDGVAIMAPETPQVRDAVARLRNAGLAVVALVSDLPNAPRDYFIGINSIAAGRTAGLLMGRFARAGGEVLVATNSLRSRDSLERRLGFDDVIAADFPGLAVLPTVESFDDPRRMEAVVAEVLRSRPRLVGIYSMGTGNTRILDALRESGRAGELVSIAHELTPATRRGLESGAVTAVITQNVGHLIRSALRVLRTLCDRTPIFEAQERIRIEIVVRENLP